MVTIHESYRNYQPPRWIRPTIERLLASIPAAELSGLGAVVLTDAASIGVGKTKRVAGRKYDRNACRGFYQGKRRGAPAYIEIVVDNAVARFPAYIFVLTVCCDLVLGPVLFHELGHHLDATIGASARTGEAAAKDWGLRLEVRYFTSRYRWLLRFGPVFGRVARWMRRREQMRKVA